MLVAPLTWYELVPGVTDTGFFNQHFVRDIGMIQLFLGVAFGLGLFRPERRVDLTHLHRGDIASRSTVAGSLKHSLDPGDDPRRGRRLFNQPAQKPRLK
ncbi:hypothetical protein [Bosea sp. Root381]|uniref:hypothetical protein n=1 Tax=Bosea sp. Root381 TaxID=1736524 RepID=UPI000AA5B573|nr:hypothetical protein [Bosea sp. Root381]